MQKYDRHSTATLTEIFEMMESDNFTGLVNGISVSLGKKSNRLQSFKKSPICSHCGLKATHFAVERDLRTAERDGGYHLNLYGSLEDGKETLFTHDHTVARGLGGTDKLSNCTTMCGPCNWKKGHAEGKAAQARAKELLLQNEKEVS